MTSNLDQTLLARACQYGAFIDVAQRSNNIQAAILHNAPQLPSTTPLYREAIHMIAYKLARLMNGQINHADSWHDIAGYAMLVHNQITQEQEAKQEAKQEAVREHPEQGMKQASKSASSDKSRGGEAGSRTGNEKNGGEAGSRTGNEKAIDAMESQIAKDLERQA